MVRAVGHRSAGPGLRALGRLIAAALVSASAGATAQAPTQPGRTAPAPVQPAPDTLVVMKLIWSAMAALDQANQTGNYSVLRDLAAPSFQTNNSPATLAGVFENLRTQRLDLGNTLLVSPTFDFAPAIIEGGVLRTRGRFPLRPTGIAFDLLFQNVAGQWRLLGIAVVPAVEQSSQTGSTRR